MRAEITSLPVENNSQTRQLAEKNTSTLFDQSLNSSSACERGVRYMSRF